MGAWGTGAFENDDAADWLAELEGATDDRVLEAAFDAVLDGKDTDLMVEGPAVAAAEVVAAALGAPAADLPEAPSEWAKGQPGHTLRPSTYRKAIKAVDQIAERSEMLDLWSEAEDFAGWQAAIVDLQTRLAGARPI